MKTLAILIFSIAVSSLGHAESFVFNTGSVTLSIGSNGVVQSLKETGSGREIVSPGAVAFAAVRKGDTLFAASEVSRRGGLLHVGFGQSRISADLRMTIEGCVLVVELVQLAGEGAQEIRILQLGTRLPNIGRLLGVEWDDRFSVSVMGLSNRVHVGEEGGVISASVYPWLGMKAERVALLAVPTASFLDHVEQTERHFHLPSPALDGEWAKRSTDVRTSYLFTDLTEANAARTIHYAKLGGFRYILIYEGTWTSSLGSYPMQRINFPHGEAGLRAVVQACHAAGLKVGLHMMMSYVASGDPLLSPPFISGLLTDGQATLGVTLDRTETRIALTSIPATMLPSKSGDFAVDGEIVHCGGASDAGGMICRRGTAGTTAAAHFAGARVRRLVPVGNSYMVDPTSPLESAISSRMADLVHRNGVDMLYLDGGGLDGPRDQSWFRAGLQPSEIWEKSGRDLLMQSGGLSNWSWHILSRGTCDDAASVAVKEYLDFHKIAESWRYYHANFMPAELGWLGIYAAAPDHAATTPDEIEYDAVRMLALNSAASFETGLSALDANGRTPEMLKLFGEYEQIRLGGGVSEGVREQLARGEWHRTADGAFHPIRYEAYRSPMPGRMTVRNNFEKQPFRFRLQVESRVAAHGDPSNVVLRGEEPGELAPPAAQAEMPGALIADKRFAAALDLTTHRPLSVELEVEGPESPVSASPVLNLQLESSGGRYRDYLVDLTFRGRRTVVLREPDESTMVTSFRPAPSAYPMKSALFAFNYGRVVAIHLRWMRYPPQSGVHCRIQGIQAVAESEGRLRDLRLSTESGSIVIPGVMKTGDYAEYWNQGMARIFDENGFLLRSVAVATAPSLATGDNRISVQAAGPEDPGENVKLTAITMGKQL